MKTEKSSMINHVVRFVKYKQSLGFKYETESSNLVSFAKYADRYWTGMPLSVEMARRWIATKPNIKPTTKLHLFSCLREFAKYLKVDQFDVELIPKSVYTVWYRRVTPYVYSNQEISLIMSTEPNIPENTFDRLTNKTIIGLLICTGMRIGEALALKKNDVDFSKGIVTVRQFKKMPMRLIPVSESAMNQLVQYSQKRESLHKTSKCDSFFVNSKGTTVIYNTFKDAWKRLMKTIGLTNGDKIPRVHDFRHTFACNLLLRAYRENRDIDDAIYMLSVYLGHTVIAGTYWYLSAVPELLEMCVNRVEENLLKRKKGGRNENQ